MMRDREVPLSPGRADWWRCGNGACLALNHPTVTQCGICHTARPVPPVTDDMKIRAESVTVPTRVHGRNGAEWAAAMFKDPMRTLPPGAGYLVAAYSMAAIAAVRYACELIEAADARLLATDGPAGGMPPDMSLTEWKVLYETLKNARDNYPSATV